MKKYYIWICPFLWMMMIFVASSISFEEGPSLFPHMDKLVHFVEFGILGMLYFIAINKSSGITSKRLLFWIAVSLTGLYGLSDELHQFFVPTREFSLYDIIADLIGGSFFCGTYLFYKRNR